MHGMGLQLARWSSFDAAPSGAKSKLEQYFHFKTASFLSDPMVLNNEQSVINRLWNACVVLCPGT
jgi:hypothetical protein